MIPASRPYPPPRDVRWLNPQLPPISADKCNERPLFDRNPHQPPKKRIAEPVVPPCRPGNSCQRATRNREHQCGKRSPDVDGPPGKARCPPRLVNARSPPLASDDSAPM